jgi:hypothetical protein
MSEDKTLIVDQMFALVREYKEMQEMIDLKSVESQELTFKPLMFPELLRIRKDLSCLSLEYASGVGDWAFDFKEAEAQRKVQYYIKKRECINAGMKIGAAETEAECDTSDLREACGTNEGLYTSGRLVLNQINEVLKSINQDISIIKKEYESINQIQ